MGSQATTPAKRIDEAPARQSNEQSWDIGVLPGRVVLCLAFALAMLLLLPFLGTIPGLHGDEAWAGARAQEILGGSRPLVGMTPYTGPIYQYLLVPVLAHFGFTVACLRLLTVVPSLICVLLYYALAKRLFGRTIGCLAALVLVCLPAFAAYGRVAFEVFALNPLLALLAILLILKSESRTLPIKGFLLCVSGVCLGLGTWNHIIFLSVPVGLLTVAFHQKRFRLFLDQGFYSVCGGMLVALAPRFYYARNHGGHLASQSGSFHDVCQRFSEWPAMLVGIIDGNLIYQRFSGEVALRLPGVVLLVFAVGTLLYFRRKGWSWSLRAKQVIIFSVFLYFTTVLICPYNADRYFLLILYVVPLFVALAFREVFRIGCLRQFWPIVVLAFALIELARTGDNYFASQHNSHGRGSTFRLGSNEETSNHFIRSDELYERLVALPARHIYAEFFIAEPLQFYDLEKRQFNSIQVVESASQVPSRFDDPDGSYVVVYDGGKRRIGAKDFQRLKQIAHEGNFIVLGPAGMGERENGSPKK